MERSEIVSWIIFVGVSIIFAGIGMIGIEIYQAKHFCDKNNATYKLEISQGEVNHLCSGFKISRYLDKVEDKVDWDFEINQNFSLDLSTISSEPKEYVYIPIDEVKK